MFSWFQHWGAKQLAISWGAYWTGLAVATLWTPVRVASYLSTLPDDHASASAGFNNTAFHLTMAEDGRTLYAGAATLLEIVLWVAGPPLLLWLVWLVSRPRPAQFSAPSTQAIGTEALHQHPNALNQPNEFDRANIGGSRPVNTPVQQPFDQPT